MKLYCSFCETSEDDAEVLVKASNGQPYNICSSCIEQASKAVSDWRYKRLQQIIKELNKFSKILKEGKK